MKTKTILAWLALGSTACLTSGKSLSLPQAQIDQNTDVAIESAPPVIAKPEGKKKSVRIDLLKKSPAFGDRVRSITPSNKAELMPSTRSRTTTNTRPKQFLNS